MLESISIGDYDVKRVTQELAVDQSEGVVCLQLNGGTHEQGKTGAAPSLPRKNTSVH